jgi:hypothetical protein
MPSGSFDISSVVVVRIGNGSDACRKAARDDAFDKRCSAEGCVVTNNTVGNPQ